MAHRTVRSGNSINPDIRKIILLLSLSLMFFPPMAHSQDQRRVELTAQEILARVDRVLDYPKGTIKGKLVHIMPDGSSRLMYIKGFIADSDYLFIFNSRERGDQLKVLYNLRGEDIWVYNIHALKLFHKMNIDKYDTILATNFSYIDLSNADFQSNYNATIVGDAVIKGYDTYKLLLDPIFKGGEYGRLTLYAEKEKFIPLRIDIHDNDKVIMKSLTIAKTMKKGNAVIPVRYDMLDIRKGTVSIIEFFGFNKNVSFNKNMFFHEDLGVSR